MMFVGQAADYGSYIHLKVVGKAQVRGVHTITSALKRKDEAEEINAQGPNTTGSVRPRPPREIGMRAKCH